MSDFFTTIATRLEETFGPAVLGSMMVGWLINLIVSLAILAAFFLLWVGVRIALRVTLHRKTDETTYSFIETIAKFTIVILAVITALDSAGVKTSALLTSLGIVGLTIGFAARDALSNLISGILIFIDRPFVLGDLVEIEGTYGRVDRITLRSTRVVTVDGRMLAVPNTQIINKTVVSYTNFPNLRIDIAVTIGVEENIDAVRERLLGLVRSDPDFMDEPEPRVVVTALNDFNVEIQLQAWLRQERRHIEKRFDLRERVFESLTQAGVTMPVETLQLHPVEVRVVQNKPEDSQ